MEHEHTDPGAITVDPIDTAHAGAGKCPLPWWKRLTLLAFLFFLIKGLAWLIVPALVVWWRASAG